MTCWLSTVRFVPDSGRGEFINVAAIAGNGDDSEIEIRAVSNWKRAKQLDEHGALSAVMDFVSSLQARVDSDSDPTTEKAKLSVGEIRRLSLEMRNAVQLSAPIPVAVATPELALDLAFEEIVLDPLSRRFSFLKKNSAQATTREAYEELGVKPLRNARVKAGPYEMDCDFAVANGRAVQLVRCWSFQLPDQRGLAEEIKAWAWGVRALRHLNGEMTVEGRASALPVPREVDVEAVFVPPTGTGSSFAADVARDAFSDRDTVIKAVSYGDTYGVAARAVELLRKTR